MAFLSLLYRNGVWVAPPLFAVSAAMLGLLIMNLVRWTKRSEILSVPLRELEEVAFPEGGRVALCGEGPLLTSRFANLTYELTTDDGMRVPRRASWFRTKSTSLTTVRMELESYDIPKPGRYVLRVQGLGTSQTADSSYRIVFTRPRLARVAVYVVGIALTAGLVIGSLVLFALAMTSQAGDALSEPRGSG